MTVKIAFESQRADSSEALAYLRRGLRIISRFAPRYSWGFADYRGQGRGTLKALHHGELTAFLEGSSAPLEVDWCEVAQFVKSVEIAEDLTIVGCRRELPSQPTDFGFRTSEYYSRSDVVLQVWDYCNIVIALADEEPYRAIRTLLS